MAVFQVGLANQGSCSGSFPPIKELVSIGVIETVCCADVDAEILHRDLWAAFDHGAQF